MLTDVVIEEDFELRSDDLWYSKQDLENGKFSLEV